MRYLIILILLSIQIVQAQKTNNRCLWYEQPAKTWKEALPVGNGRLGAMVFGDTEFAKTLAIISFYDYR